MRLEKVGRAGITYRLRNLGMHKIGSGFVGLFVRQQIAERSKEIEPSPLPDIFINLLPFSIRDAEGGPIGDWGAGRPTGFGERAHDAQGSAP